MGFQAQSGQVGFKTQSAKGSFAAPGSGGVFMRTTGGSLGIKRDLLVPDPEIGGNRDIPNALLGAVAFAGQYDFYGRLEALATLLYGAFGAKSSATAGTGSALVGTHTITPATVLPWLSIEEAVSTWEIFNYTDAKVNMLHLEADANGYLKGTADLIALTQVAGATATATPPWDVTPLLVGTNTVVKFGGVDLKGKNFKFEINNNIESNDFRLGSVSLGDAVAKRRDITAEVTIRPEDSVLWRQAAYGSTGTAPVAGATVKGAFQITVTSYEVIGTSVTVYTLDILIPSAAIKPFDVKPQGDNVVETTLQVQALRPDPTVDIATVTVKNDKATVA